MVDTQGICRPSLSSSWAQGVWQWLNIGVNIKLFRKVTVVVLASRRSRNLSREDFLDCASLSSKCLRHLQNTCYSCSSPDMPAGRGNPELLEKPAGCLGFPERGVLNYEVAKFTSQGIFIQLLNFFLVINKYRKILEPDNVLVKKKFPDLLASLTFNLRIKLRQQKDGICSFTFCYLMTVLVTLLLGNQAVWPVHVLSCRHQSWLVKSQSCLTLSRSVMFCFAVVDKLHNQISTY